MGGFGKALAEKERENGREDVIIDMLKKGNSPEAISDFCGYALSFVKEIQKKMENAAVWHNGNSVTTTKAQRSL